MESLKSILSLRAGINFCCSNVIFTETFIHAFVKKILNVFKLHKILPLNFIDKKNLQKWSEYFIFKHGCTCTRNITPECDQRHILQFITQRVYELDIQ
jgi:hypothetical protein